MPFTLTAGTFYIGLFTRYTYIYIGIPRRLNLVEILGEVRKNYMNKELNHSRTRWISFRKGVCLFTSFCFLLTDSFSIQLLHAQTLVRPAEMSNVESPKAISVSADTIASLSLPSDLGTLDEIYIHEAEAADTRSDKAIIIIQDAHAVPDAQISIQNNIDYFQRKYGINLIGIEGTSGKLDPTIFRNMPSKEVVNEVFNEYLRRGELSGAAAAAVLNKKEGHFFGVEDQALYETAIDSFLEALNIQQSFLSELKPLGDKLNQLKEKYYSRELYEVDKQALSFDEDSTKVTAFMTYLKKEFKGHDKPDFKEQYPYLGALMEELVHENAGSDKARLKRN